VGLSDQTLLKIQRNTLQIVIEICFSFINEKNGIFGILQSRWWKSIALQPLGIA